MKIREPLWSIFDKLWGHPEETLSKKLDITEIKDAKMNSFSSDFQTMIQH